MGKRNNRLKGRRLFSILLAMVLALTPPAQALAATGDTVVFKYQYDGKSDETRTVNSSDYVEEPEAPQRDGYTFGGWYKHATAGMDSDKYDFSKTITDNDIDKTGGNYILYAKWTENKVIDPSTFLTLRDEYWENLKLEVGGEQWYSFTPTQTDNYTLSVCDQNGVDKSDYFIWDYGTDYYGNAASATYSVQVSLEKGKTYYFKISTTTYVQAGRWISFLSESSSSATENKKEIGKCDITCEGILSQGYGYTGSEIKPAVTITVRDGITVLQKDVDYTVSYINNINVGNNTAAVRINGIGNYTSYYDIPFTIKASEVEKKNISSCTIEGNIQAYTYTGSPIEPAVTVKDGGTALIKGTDYTVSYANNVNAGTATITISGIGSKYTGSVTRNFTINKAVLGKTPDSVIEVSAGQKVSDVSLAAYPNWKWKDGDKDRKLTPGNTTKAVAQYTGTDKDNYSNSEIEISITRKKVLVSDFALTKSEEQKRKGETFALEVTGITPANADTYTVVWTSDNEKVASVAGNGNSCTVTAGQSGSAVVTAEINGIRKSCTVTVTNPLTGFKLSSNKEEIVVGNSTILGIAETTPEEPDDYTADWQSDNESVATVKKEVNRNSGKVTAVGEGTATIKATIVSGGETYTQECQVTVIKAEAVLTDIEINPTAMSLQRDVGENIDVKPMPEKASLGEVTFASDNPDVASVSTDGRVTAGDSGTATITVSAGGYSKQCIVTVNNKLTSFELDKTAVAMKKDEQMQLRIDSEKPKKPDSYQVAWVSSDTNVVTVDDQGNVAALKTGTATVTATINSIARTCTVTVTTPATGFTLNEAMVTLTEGNSHLVTYTTVPEDADKTYTIEWNSSNPSVADVVDGRISAKAAGTADITARMNVGGQVIQTQTCQVTVEAAKTDVTLTGIQITPANLELKTGDTTWITVGPEPEGVALGDITYVSGDERIVTVTSAGRVTAVNSGTTTITVTAGGFTKTCNVTVEKSNPSLCTVVYMDDKNNVIDRIEIAPNEEVILPDIEEQAGTVRKWKDMDGTLYEPQTEITVEKDMTFVIDVQHISVNSLSLNVSEKTIKAGESFTLSVTVQPEGALKEVMWSSSNTSVATVDASGKVTGVAAGQAEITANAKDGSGTTAVCKVTVTAAQTGDKDTGNEGTGNTGTGDKDTGNKDTGKVSVASIKITGPTKKVAPEKKITLAAEVYPDNATDKQVTWSVSDSKYASVNGSGVVTTTKAGKGKSVVVTAASKDGTVKATYKISIMKNAVKKVKITGKKSLKVGKSTKLKVKITPNKNVSKEVAWSSSKPNVATVSSSGKVVAKKKGKTKITATAKDGSGKKAKITITVK